MPMKCIDQMPMPIAAAPPSNHQRPDEGPASATRAASFRAVYATTMATRMDRPTSQRVVACFHGEGQEPELPRA